MKKIGKEKQIGNTLENHLGGCIVTLKKGTRPRAVVVNHNQFAPSPSLVVVPGGSSVRQFLNILRCEGKLPRQGGIQPQTPTIRSSAPCSIALGPISDLQFHSCVS
jgi:hypothetical protein